MSDFLYRVDAAVFYFFNHTLSFPLLDRFFGTITNVNNWFLVYLLLGYLIVRKYKWKGAFLFCVALIMITASDQTGFRLLKEYFARPRPFRALPGVLLPVGESGTWSFPSNHAINNVAAAVFFSSVFPRYKIALFIAASLVALSRVYCGLHYPSDIIGGAMIGLLFGYVFVRLYNFLAKKWGLLIQA
jgi:undecaprenyl-diphosphatase